jgi:hypothetical protein
LLFTCTWREAGSGRFVAELAARAAGIRRAVERIRALSIGATDVVGAGTSVVAAARSEVAVEVVGAAAVPVADVRGARTAVIAIGVVGDTFRVDAIGAARALGLVVDADVILARLAAGTLIVRAAAIGWNTGIAAAATWCGAFAAGGRAISHRTAGGIAASLGTAALVIFGAAAFIYGFAEDEREVAAEFFAVADAEATSVVTTFAVNGADSGRVAAIRTAFFRHSGRARTDSANRHLLPGTPDWCWSGRRPPCGVDTIISEGPTNRGDTSQAEQSLEESAPARTRG